MEKVFDVANYICEEYFKLSGERIDEMKLHKLLYFSQRENLAFRGELLFKEDFEGWKYGPVCVNVRKNFCEGEMLCGKPGKISSDSEYIVNNVIAQYAELASWKLSQLSHAELSWINSRKGLSCDQNGHKALSVEDMKKDAEKVRPYDSIWDMYIDEFEDYEEEI